jgi:hypothetical protein
MRISISGKLPLRKCALLWLFILAPYNLSLGQANHSAPYEPAALNDYYPAQGEESQPGQYQLSREDSLNLKLLDIEIGKAIAQVDQTDFWHRLIPEIRLVASIGVRDVFFIDPAAYVPYIWPTDTYRITGSISLSEVFNSGKHILASLELARLHIQRSKLLEHFRRQASSLAAKRVALQNELSLTAEEIGLHQRLARYTDLLFQQGEIKYDALIRSKLQLLNARKNLEKLAFQIQVLDNRISPEGEK